MGMPQSRMPMSSARLAPLSGVRAVESCATARSAAQARKASRISPAPLPLVVGVRACANIGTRQWIAQLLHDAKWAKWYSVREAIRCAKGRSAARAKRVSPVSHALRPHEVGVTGGASDCRRSQIAHQDDECLPVFTGSTQKSPPEPVYGHNDQTHKRCVHECVG